MSTSERRIYPSSHIVNSEGITRVEPVSFAVADFIKFANFEPVAINEDDLRYDTRDGDPLDVPRDQLGIVTEIYIPKYDYLRSGVWVSRTFKKLCGRIEFVNSGGIPELADKDWILFVFGKDHVGEMTGLATGLQEKFSKKIGIYLESQSNKSPEYVPTEDEE